MVSTNQLEPDIITLYSSMFQKIIQIGGGPESSTKIRRRMLV